jgi:hypothetical protein
MEQTTKGQIKADKNVDAFKFLSVEKGVQAIVRIDGSPAMLTVVNPTTGKPYIVYNNDGFDGIVGLEK